MQVRSFTSSWGIRSGFEGGSLRTLSTWCFFVATFHVVLLTAGCAGTDLRTQDAELGAAASAPSWPPPPQTERIRYIRSIAGPSDVGIKKSWLKRAFDTILGKEETEERILRPYAVFADKSRVYVTDPGAHVLHVFDLNGGNYFQITEAKKEELVSPIGVAADENGEVYLSDSVLHEVFIYDREGKYLRELGSPELFVRPTGIALDGERVYVVDTHVHQVLVFMKKNGQLISRIGKNGRERGEFNYPTNVVVRKGLLYIVDSMNFRVQVLGVDGSFRSAFGKLGDGSGDFSKPKGIAVDSDGHIYVSDAHFDVVQIFSDEGRLLLGFGNTGSGPGEMSLPAGVFIDEQDRVYVADSYNNRVQVFQYLKEKK